MTKTLIIEGMTCGHCASHVQKALNAIDGIKATVDLDSRIVTVELSKPVDDKTLKKAVQEAGYKVKSIK